MVHQGQDSMAYICIERNRKIIWNPPTESMRKIFMLKDSKASDRTAANTHVVYIKIGT